MKNSMVFFKRGAILLLFIAILSSIFPELFKPNSVIFYQASFVKLRSVQVSLIGQSAELTKEKCLKFEKLLLEILILRNSLRFWLNFADKYSRLSERETDEKLKKKYSEKEEKGNRMVLKYSNDVSESLDTYDDLLKLLFECLKIFGEHFHPYSIIKRNKSLLRYIDYY
ncbi:hypothetical protein FG379_000131 [Cryptosporidium bovis]|uniref:uncharacterized protein n=1 Tax=Cryptosporidium bovis TaxID=310047 RepID=UPI00351A3276|nr:hypothetical protein FG379_000131 [Cryptosporidium bovis]